MDTRTLHRTIFLLSLATFSSMAIQRICDPMLPELSRSFGQPLSLVSQVVSLYAVAHGLMQFFWGPLGDRLGKFRLVVWCLLGCGVGSLLCALSSQLEWLVLARMLTAVFSAALVPLSLAWIGDQVPYEVRQATLARLGLGTMLGIAGGQLLGGLLSDTLGWRWAFGLMAVFFLAVCALLRLQNVQEAGAHGQAAGMTGFVQRIAQVLASTWARILLGMALLEGAAVLGVLAVTAAHLHQAHGLSLSAAGGTSALYGLGGMLYMATARQMIAWLGELNLGRLGALLIGVAFGVVGLSPDWRLAMPACFAAGFGFGMLHSTLQVKATQMVPEARATCVTLFAGAMFAGQSMGVLVLSEAMTVLPSSTVITLGACMCLALAAVFTWSVRRHDPALRAG
jgi:predicted MFS family arabinose efflux permease